MKPLLDFLLDGKKYAMRTWDQIPRVGDTVIFKDGEVWAEVTRVIWAEDSAARSAGIQDRQWAQIICKSVQDPTKE